MVSVFSGRAQASPPRLRRLVRGVPPWRVSSVDWGSRTARASRLGDRARAPREELRFPAEALVVRASARPRPPGVRGDSPRAFVARRTRSLQPAEPGGRVLLELVPSPGPCLVAGGAPRSSSATSADPRPGSGGPFYLTRSSYPDTSCARYARWSRGTLGTSWGSSAPGSTARPRRLSTARAWTLSSPC